MTWNRTDLYKQMAGEMFENGVADYSDAYTIHSYYGHQSPDTRAHIEGVEYTKGLMEQYGAGNKDIVISEMGWTAVQSKPEECARWIVKYAAMVHNVVERVDWYVAQKKRNKDAGEGEIHFGWMQDEGVGRNYVAYAPMPQMRAVSNYNSYVATAEKTAEINAEDSNAVIHRFKRTDGYDVLMTWIKDGGEEEVSAVNLGINSAIVSDMYGNETEYETRDGKLYITLTNEPQYIIGKFDEVSVEKADFSVSTASVDVTRNDMCKISVVKPDEVKNAVVELELPDNMTAFENKGFVGNIADILIKTGSSPKENEQIELKVVDKGTGRAYYTEYVTVNYVEACVIDIAPKLGLDGRWKMGISLKNMKNVEPISGTVKIVTPVFSDEVQASFTFENLGTKETVTKYIHFPDWWSEKRNNVICKVALNSGEIFETNNQVNLCGIPYAVNKPVIDGIISESEWNKDMPFVINSERYKPTEMETSWTGPDDLSANFYYNWDQENLYVAAEVQDNVLCDAIENQMWQNDEIQFAIALSNESGAPRTELGFGLHGDEVKYERSAYMPIIMNVTGGIQDDGILEYAEFEVKREGTMTYYEGKIPWSELTYDGFNILSCDAIYMCMIVNDNDGRGRRGWLEFCPGIAWIKDAATFEKVKLYR